MSKKRAAFLIILLLSLRAYTFSQVLTPDAIARFHINEANYLADVGKYLEAIEDLNTASGFAETAAIKAEAVSLKANLLSVFLDNPQTAMQAYDNIIRDFTATAYYEPAIFQAGMLRYQGGDPAGATTFFARYLREFPAGPRASTAEFLLDRVKAGEKARITAAQRPIRPTFSARLSYI